jgi:hypothetical protein
MLLTTAANEVLGHPASRLASAPPIMIKEQAP